MQLIKNNGAVTLVLANVLAMLLGTTVARAATITYVGAFLDRTNYSDAGLNLGNAGYWFAQFNAASPVSGRPTDENDRFAPPTWASFNFTTVASDPSRTFSFDNGGVKSEGGKSTWNVLTLPNGETGLSGSLVDPQTLNNSNNTVNQILLGANTPSTFYLSIVVDNTNFEHDPSNRIRARGNDSGTDIDPNTFPNASNLTFNGIADVYTFRYDGFGAGDYIKIQLNGAAAPNTGAGFSGLMFDTALPEPSTLMLALCGGSVLLVRRFRSRGRIVRATFYVLAHCRRTAVRPRRAVSLQSEWSLGNHSFAELIRGTNFAERLMNLLVSSQGRVLGTRPRSSMKPGRQVEMCRVYR